MRSQRGFDYVQLALVLGIVAAVVGGGIYFVSWIKGLEAEAVAAYARGKVDGTKEGKAEVMQLWQSEALQSTREDVDAQRGRQATAAAAAKNLQDANARAAAAEEELEQRRNQHEPSTVVEGCSPQPGSAPVVRFTWNWVRDYDAAWTGLQGEPVFGDRPSAQEAPGGPDAASPYGPDELAGVHAINAHKCSETRRQLNSLLDTLDKLEAAEDARLKGTNINQERGGGDMR